MQVNGVSSLVLFWLLVGAHPQFHSDPRARGLQDHGRWTLVWLLFTQLGPRRGHLRTERSTSFLWSEAPSRCGPDLCSVLHCLIREQWSTKRHRPPGLPGNTAVRRALTTPETGPCPLGVKASSRIPSSVHSCGRTSCSPPALDPEAFLLPVTNQRDGYVLSLVRTLFCSAGPLHLC